jgi:hypothetical protein
MGAGSKGWGRGGGQERGKPVVKKSNKCCNHNQQLPLDEHTVQCVSSTRPRTA